MKTRKQAEARALELFPKVPIHSQHYVTNQIGRQAFLQCFDEMQQDKCERSGHREQSLKAIDEFLKTEEGKRYISEMQANKQTCGFCVEPKQHQKELLKEMMRKDEESGMYDDLSDVINNVNTDSAINMGRTLSIADDNPIVYSDADASKTIKEAFENIPKEVKDRHAKAAYKEHKQLREAAEKVVKECIAYKEGHHNRPDDMYLILAIDDLEKSLR